MAKQTSPLQRLRQLDKQREKLLDHAKQEALAVVEHALEGLNALGFSFRLTDAASRKTAKKAVKKRTRTMKDAPCPICGFKTSPTHDGRAHRSQKSKKPFTPDELKERGLTKV